MQVFIANIDSISKTPDMYSALLSPENKARLSKFQHQTRKLQFILGHLIADNCKKNYTSIAHKDKWVVVATGNDPLGIDIENTSIQRDFIGAAELMNFAVPKSSKDFYKSFTKSEAVYKLGQSSKCTRFIQYQDYLICIAATKEFGIPKLEFYSPSSILATEKK